MSRFKADPPVPTSYTFLVVERMFHLEEKIANIKIVLTIIKSHLTSASYRIILTNATLKPSFKQLKAIHSPSLHLLVAELVDVYGTL